MNTLEKALLSSKFCEGVPREVLSKLASSYPYEVKQFHKKEIIITKGEPLKQMMLVAKGLLHAEMTNDVGKSLFMDEFTPGRIIAPAILLASQNFMPVNVVADKECEVICMEKGVFIQMLEECPLLMNNCMRMVCDIAMFLTRKVHSLVLTSLQKKISVYLLTLSTEANNSPVVTIKSSWSSIAARFGVNRQSLARVLNQMEEDELISVDGKKITLLAPHKMHWVD